MEGGQRRPPPRRPPPRGPPPRRTEEPVEMDSSAQSVVQIPGPSVPSLNKPKTGGKAKAKAKATQKPNQKPKPKTKPPSLDEEGVPPVDAKSKSKTKTRSVDRSCTLCGESFRTTKVGSSEFVKVGIGMVSFCTSCNENHHEEVLQSLSEFMQTPKPSEGVFDSDEVCINIRNHGRCSYCDKGVCSYQKFLHTIVDKA